MDKGNQYVKPPVSTFYQLQCVHKKVYFTKLRGWVGETFLWTHFAYIQ